MIETIKSIEIIRHPSMLDDPYISKIQDRIFESVNMPDVLDKQLMAFIEKFLVEEYGFAKEEMEFILPYINKVPKPFGWWQLDLGGIKLGKYYLLKKEQKVALHWFDDLQIQNKEYFIYYLRVFGKFL